MTDLRKPVRRVARNCKVPHGMSPDIVVSLYPGGIIGLREARRRKEYQVAAVAVYTRLVLAEMRERKGRRK